MLDSVDTRYKCSDTIRAPMLWLWYDTWGIPQDGSS